MAHSHWLLPLKGEPAPSTHLLLWQEAISSRRRPNGAAGNLLPGRRRAWLLRDRGGRLELFAAHGWDDTDGLLDVILPAQPPRGQTTVWLVRGWQDLVLTGMAELIDRGTFDWRYALLDGARCLFRGTLAGRATVLTSLPCWTGGRWDAWPQCLESDPAKSLIATIAPMAEEHGEPVGPEERLALATLVTIVYASHILKCGTVAPTVAGGARKLWRSWLGERVWVEQIAAKKKRQRVERFQRCYVAPLPTRPDAAAAAERHVCYGLPREQYFCGRYDGPVHVVDTAAAYLCGLLDAPQPVAYRECLKNTTPTELAANLAGGTGLALCLVESADAPYPVRRQRQPGRAVGRFWTWLCGAELAAALCTQAVAEVHTAWLWSAKQRSDDDWQMLMKLPQALKESAYPAVQSVFRALYCAAVGQWATWSRSWIDTDYPHSFGPWGCWSGADPETGEEVKYRSIAGRVQKLAGRASAPGSVPLVFGSVTASLRTALDAMRDHAGKRNVLALCADALWVTAEGMQRLLDSVPAAAADIVRFKTKTTYDKIWMNGKGRAVVERDGRLFAVLSGVPHDEPADRAGTVHWSRVEDWSTGRAPNARRGVRSAQAAFNAMRFVRDNDYPYRPNCPWFRLMDGQLVEELLVPRRPAKDVIDEQ